MNKDSAQDLGFTVEKIAQIIEQGSFDDFVSSANEIASNIQNLIAFENFVASNTFYHEKYERYYITLIEALVNSENKGVLEEFLSSTLNDGLGTAYKIKLLKDVLEKAERFDDFEPFLEGLCSAMVLSQTVKPAIFFFQILSLNSLTILFSSKLSDAFEGLLTDYILEFLLNKYGESFIQILLNNPHELLLGVESRSKIVIPIDIIIEFLTEDKRKKYVNSFFSEALNPNHRVVKLAIYLWQKYNLGGKNKRFDWMIETFGANLDYDIYSLVDEGLRGVTKQIEYPFSVPTRMLKLNGEGLKHTLEQQLQSDFNDVVALNENGNRILEILTGEGSQESAYIRFLLLYLSRRLRFDKSEWFTGSLDQLVELLTIYKENYHESTIEVSQEIEVHKSKGQFLDQASIDQSSRVAFEEVIEILRSSIEFLKNTKQSIQDIYRNVNNNEYSLPMGFVKGFFQDIQNLTKSTKSDLFDQYREAFSEEVAELSLPKMILFLKHLVLNHHLDSHSYNKLLVKYLFVSALVVHPEQIQELTKLVSEPKLSYRTITMLLNFIQHIALEETSRELIQKFKVQDYIFDELKQLLPLEHLTEILFSTVDIESESTTELTFEVRRDLVSEFSGQIADACWAGREDESILFDYTNIETVSIKEGGRFIGSCVLIKSVDNSGNPVLILRGVNPRESEVNKLSVAKFMSALLKFVASYARKLNYKPLIVIDDHIGGSATNRPKVFFQLQNLKKIFVRFNNLTDRIEKSNMPTVFNGYYIQDTVYEIPERPEGLAEGL